MIGIARPILTLNNLPMISPSRMPIPALPKSMKSPEAHISGVPALASVGDAATRTIANAKRIKDRRWVSDSRRGMERPF
ncbi:MAG: hypothetical protein B6D36_16320 [Planctomycetes bacterium UTPLA1]|nr:MAG: hypothetical protein B6D36_16320 [Planctomycetes bacterium UTPLA1]